eukprot:CAMPEP_0202859524 /NCGR_PEP_ID=MMETSP1391-20130828/1593_1 /ASSEMBLY_ACC=CAM_ASM_000867 /TAXON_ID=1034604 /ORGANISM="Chlamydomonas leiostraca, Strain SAG 11-49" /LENGTH=257 /DNA_ID=CAMNT_0049538559 /DNA_START=314 /DNA_END=1084 /DNA_ORIENTATION=-
MKLAVGLLAILAMAAAASASDGRSLQQLVTVQNFPYCRCISYLANTQPYIAINPDVGTPYTTSDGKFGVEYRVGIAYKGPNLDPTVHWCYQALEEQLYKIIFDVDPTCQAAWNTGGKYIRVAGPTGDVIRRSGVFWENYGGGKASLRVVNMGLNKTTAPLTTVYIRVGGVNVGQTCGDVRKFFIWALNWRGPKDASGYPIELVAPPHVNVTFTESSANKCCGLPPTPPPPPRECDPTIDPTCVPPYPSPPPPPPPPP